MKRIGTLVTATLAVFTLALSLAPRVAAQDVVQDDSPKQTIHFQYPDGGIILSGTGDDAVVYKGIVYVSVFPITPRLKKKYGDGPMYTNELAIPSQGNLGRLEPQLPLGVYEVDFSMRDGDDLKTCVKRPVILSPQGGVSVTPEFGNAKTIVIGGDLTFQQLEDAMYGLSLEVKDLKAQVAALKGKAGAAPAK